MKRRLSNRRTEGLTLTEVIYSLAVIVVVVAAVLYPQLRPRRKGCHCRPSCVSNLKQVGLAFRMFSQDHGDKFPWAVSTNEGGTLEYADSADVFRHFVAISNELPSPKPLTCNGDVRRTKASAWHQLTNNTDHLSYFVGLDADESRPQTIISGDRNLTTNGKPALGVVTISSGTVLGFTRELHRTHGNIALGDGSAQQVSNAELQKQTTAQLQSGPTQFFRLALP